MSTQAPVESGRIIAPYITTWSAEQDLPSRLVEHPLGGIGYADEGLGDRDAHGVLWSRIGVRVGTGRPEFGKVHPLRQRRAMRKLLCQVCAGPADRTDEGVLWLLRDYRGDWPRWPEGMASTEPPVCVSCVAISLKRCPALHRGAVAVRVRECPIAGVRGAVYQRGMFGPTAVMAANVTYDAPEIRWTVASALIRELKGCALVSLEDLVAEATSAL
ncbi:hypothetical protein Lesp02_42600 [Lentzea sp. NBRC 105346]|uniref:hypothetical protein n=1 Tax=Lentzea sp. NBRC 105346 TaxID=3032205 RepID=UPI0024A24F3F|nr:hypothetical protein [Lentzea sp. NBRC 105346]GLZ32072.1 hypothetical protein Lesp02_42600 [Lentzea sp. NBRC 105346]